MNEPTAKGATYRIGVAPLGFAIVMKDDEGRETCIETGIKSYATAMKKRDNWTRREMRAQEGSR